MEVATEIEEAIAEAVTAGSLRAAARNYPAFAQIWGIAADDASVRGATLVARFAMDWARRQART